MAILSITLLICCIYYAKGQWASVGNQNPVTSDRVFYMDSASQCSAKRFEVDRNSATILGREAVQTNPGTITECMITLTSNRPGEMRRFQVEIVRGSVSDAGVHFHMYDGPDNTGNRIFTISKGTPVDQTRKYMTSGGSVTFYLSRGSINDANYQIELHVVVVPGDPTTNDECKTGNEYGCIHYGYQQVVDKETVIGIVGGVFGLILFIVIPIIVICCYRKSKGVNKKWDEFRLADKVNTAADIHASSASLTKSKKEMWTSQSSKAPYSDMKRSHRSRYSDGSASEFSASIDLPPKHRPPPPPYDESERRYRDERYRNDRYSDDGLRSDRFRNNRYNDRENRYNERVDRDYRAERNGRNRYESDRKSYYSSSDDNSFVQARDDHPQEVFVERVIEPRVKPTTKSGRQQMAKYYEDDEDTYDTIVDKESPKLKVKKKEVKESAIQADSSEDNESNTESDNEPPSTDETDDDDIIRKKEKEAKKSALYAKPNKSKKEKLENNQQAQPIPQQPVPGPYPIPPGGVHMVPGQAIMYNTQHPMMLPRPVAPIQQPYFTQPPHPRPLMTMSAIPQQPVMGQVYPQPPVSGRLPAPVHRPPTYSTSQNHPQQPVFTHLVQRGYGQDSASVDGSDGGRYHTDESDVMANLGSGVEFMKRNQNESTV